VINAISSDASVMQKLLDAAPKLDPGTLKPTDNWHTILDGWRGVLGVGGDLGLVGVMILERNGALGRVDTFLMSCRVLGRGLERAIAIHCLDVMASAWGIESWEAEFIPTRKNMQTADFWPRNGFVRMRESEERVIYVRGAREKGGEIPAHIAIRED